MKRNRTVTSTALALGIALVLGGCSGGSNSDNAEEGAVFEQSSAGGEAAQSSGPFGESSLRRQTGQQPRSAEANAAAPSALGAPPSNPQQALEAGGAVSIQPPIRAAEARRSDAPGVTSARSYAPIQNADVGYPPPPPLPPLADEGYPQPEPPQPGRRPLPPRDMFFRDYGANPWEDPRQDRLSTFAMDVDSGSYTVLRSYLQQGLLPPYEAIRAEEFVNYFRQDYPPPKESAFSLTVDGAPSPFGEEYGTLVRVGIQGRSADVEQRRDAVLTFVVDVSGSMDIDNRLELVKQALRLLVDQLGPGDEVGVVAFTDQAWVALPTTRASDRRTIVTALDELHPMDSTNAEAGLVLGYDLAERAYRRGAVNRIVLCSDGVANVGATFPKEILDRIERNAERDITLTSIGVGMENYNDELMEQLADQGDGAYYYVDDLREAERVFVTNLTGTLQVIARDAKTQVEFNPDVVSAYRLIGYENRDVADPDFENDTVDAGEVGAGQSVTALYSVRLQPEARGEMATVRVRYREPDEGNVRELSAVLRTDDLAPSFEHAAARFRLDVAIAAFAEILRDSDYRHEQWLDQVVDIAQAAARELGGDADVTELIDLMNHVRRIAVR